MKKIIIISLFTIFVVTGCFKKDPVQTGVDGQLSESSEDNLAGVDDQVSEPSKDALALGDWLSSGQAVECTIQSDQGEVKMFGKDGKILMEGIGFSSENPNDIAYVLTDDEWSYIWSGNTGTKMNLREMENIGEESELTEEDASDWQDSVRNWEQAGYQYDCQEKNLPDSLFEEPTDVEFSDMSVFLNQNMELGNGIEGLIESGYFDDLDMEQLQKMMDESNSEIQ